MAPTSIFLNLFSFLEDYFYQKTRKYFILAQVVVDYKKRSIDVLYMNVNDSIVMCRYGLYKLVQYFVLFDVNKGCENGSPPYLLGDKGYLLITWIIATYKKEGTHKILEFCFIIRKHKWM